MTWKPIHTLPTISKEIHQVMCLLFLSAQGAYLDIIKICSSRLNDLRGQVGTCPVAWGGKNGFHLYSFWTRHSSLSLNLQCSLPIAPIFTLVPALTLVRPGRLDLSHYIIYINRELMFWSFFWVQSQDTWSDQDLFLIYKYIWRKGITSKPTYLHI